MKSAGVIFRKIGGRVIPIVEKHPVASGFAMLTAAAVVAPKIRRKVVKNFGSKSGSLGVLGNVSADVGISAGLLYGAQKLGGAAVSKSLHSVLKVLRKSV